MNRKGIIIGIDTSNYTTSLAILDENGNLIENIKKLLPVKPGERGLRQSDAVFAHTKNFPEVFENASEHIRGKRVIAIGVSERPRNVEGSYMPCFLSGVGVAKALSVSCDAPLYTYSHQCGHIMAALYSSGITELAGERFCAFHISGGTTELVEVNGFERGFRTRVAGGTLDISAGQLIDRIGVYFGCQFPAGAAIESLALGYCKSYKSSRISVKDGFINLSGIENKALSMYKQSEDKQAVSRYVLDTVTDSLIAMRLDYEEKHGQVDFVYAGGVMSNSIIKEKISKSHSRSHFASAALSSDNAVGIAYLAYKQIKDKL